MFIFVDTKLTLVFFLQNLIDRTRIPTDEEIDKVKEAYSALDYNSPEMRALRDHHDEHRVARRKAYAAEFPGLAAEFDRYEHFFPHTIQGDQSFYSFFAFEDEAYRRQDEENRRRISHQRSRHFMYGASMDYYYDICGAGAPFERLYFEARDQLQHATDELARERCDRAYEAELRAEWEDFDCIDGFLDSQEKLRTARYDLARARNQIWSLTDEVRLLKQELVAASAASAAFPNHPPPLLSHTPRV